MAPASLYATSRRPSANPCTCPPPPVPFACVQGVRNVPMRLRIQVSRRRNDDEDAKEELYSFVTVSDDQSGKLTTVVDEA